MKTRCFHPLGPLSSVLVALALGSATLPAVAGPTPADSAKKIDQLVGQALEARGLEPNAQTTDLVFLRRAYLDITGTIPTYQQIQSFVGSSDPQRRARLIDQLLASPGYVSHFYNFWADILRLKTRLRQISGVPYLQWVKQALEKNMPYDQFVHAMLSAEGRIEENGAAGYYLRDTGMPLDNTANTFRVFLGTQIGCAQCHDHPFDKWTQYEFYEAAAFTYGTLTRNRGPVNYTELRREANRQELSPQEQAALRRLVRLNSYKVADNKYRRLRLPDDYKYDDAKPKDLVEPATIFGDPAPVPRGHAPRTSYAKWVTSKDNPVFARVIANRLWKKVMGVGIVEPVDDFRDDRKPSNPQLLDFLAAEIVRLDFDMKQFLRILYNTETYQRMATRRELQPAQPYYHQGPILRRMSAEQLWDAMLTLVIPDPDGRTSPAEILVSAQQDRVDIHGKSTEEVVAMAKDMASRYRRSGSSMMQRRAQMARLMKEDAKYRGLPRQLVRASELVSPAPPGHFLRQFGQSDRDQIENANADATVTQALTLLNGPVYGLLNSQRSELAKVVASQATPARKIDAVFLSTLCRYPSSEERAMALQEIRANGTKGLGDITWALLNTREFMFVQ